MGSDRTQPTTSDRELKVSTLELFFDLVFVFAITQVTAVFIHDPTSRGLWRGALLLMLLMWTWSIYTWTTNWTGTERLGTRLSLLAAMAVSLIMAEAVPDAFEESGIWFAVSLFAVRMFAFLMLWLGTRYHPEQRTAYLTFLPLASVAAVLILLGGFLGPTARVLVWVVALLVDFASAASSGRGTFEIQAGHFAERYGLLIIIALGESIVAIGVGAAGVEKSASWAAALVVAFAGAAALWWSYFDRAGPAAERQLRYLEGQERGRFARDVYSILHYPIVLGVVLYAVAAEEMVAHLDDPLTGYARFALASGISLVLLSMAAGYYRAIRKIPFERAAASAVVILLAVAGSDVRGLLLTAASTIVIVVALVFEDGRLKRLRAAASS